MKIESDNRDNFLSGVMTLVGAPAMEMLAWGAFLHMEHIHLLFGHSPYIGYWGWFMINLIVVVLFWPYIPRKWHLKKD